MAGELPPPKTFTDWIAAITAAQNRLELFRLRPLLAARRASAAEDRHHHRRRHRGHAGFAAGSLGRHAAAGFFLSGNDRHQIAPRARRKFCAKPSKKLIRSRIRATAPCSRRTRPTPPCRNCCSCTARAAQKRKWRVSIHVAESAQEFEMFQHARGAMHDWLKRNERDNSDCGLGSPVAHLARQQTARRKCPRHPRQLPRARRRHAARQKPNPRRPLSAQPRLFQASAVSSASGSPTPASISASAPTASPPSAKPANKNRNWTCSPKCARWRTSDKTISPVEILQMATVNGARALGLAGKVGELSPGAFADLIAIPFAGKISRCPRGGSGTHRQGCRQHDCRPLGNSPKVIRRTAQMTPKFVNACRVFSGDSCRIARQPRAAPAATFSARSSR